MAGKTCMLAKRSTRKGPSEGPFDPPRPSAAGQKPVVAHATTRRRSRGEGTNRPPGSFPGGTGSRTPGRGGRRRRTARRARWSAPRPRAVPDPDSSCARSRRTPRRRRRRRPARAASGSTPCAGSEARPVDEPPHAPRQNAQAQRLGVFVAALEQQLHPDADPEEGAPAGQKGPDRLAESAAATIERSRAGSERPLAGDDQLVGTRHGVGVGADGPLRAHGGQRLLDAAEVAAPQIGDDDAATHVVSVPLVEGTPTTRGSSRAAALVARANALNSASIMWWAFSP